VHPLARREVPDEHSVQLAHGRVVDALDDGAGDAELCRTSLSSVIHETGRFDLLHLLFH
jgi:hypothetical protein